jgi:hypothetical protein
MKRRKDPRHEPQVSARILASVCAGLICLVYVSLSERQHSSNVEVLASRHSCILGNNIAKANERPTFVLLITSTNDQEEPSSLLNVEEFVTK